MIRWAGLAFLLLWFSTAVFHLYKTLPAGIDAATPFRAGEDVALLVDATWIDAAGAQEARQHTRQAIFDEMLRLIAQAQQLIVLDLFLYNDFAGAVDAQHRPLSSELTEALVRRARTVEGLTVVLITDPINQVYGGLRSPGFTALRAAGVTVIETDLRPLRDSNPLWSGFWRLCCQWLGDDFDGGWLPNPLGAEDAPKVPLRSLLAMANFKANHRKTLVVDSDDGWTGLVTSANPHDASSRHSNVAVRFSGPAALDLLATEHAVARMSGQSDAFAMPAAGRQSLRAAEGDEGAGGAGSVASLVGASLEAGAAPALRVLTESRIRDAALELIETARPGDRLDLAMFYLAHRDIIRALVGAHQRGALVRVLLDPNEAAFGLEKDGVPNRPVATELHAVGVEVRWANTRAEQFHTKLLLRTTREGRIDLLAGSANFTRRNLDNLNLETNVQLRGTATVDALRDAQGYFETRWHNERERRHSTAYESRADPSLLRYWRYRFMEATGLSTF